MMDQKSTRVVIVSEQAIFLRGLQSLVMAQARLHLVGEARTASETLQLCRLARPEMILIDLNHRPGDWQETICTIQKQWPLVQIVLLLETRDETWADEEFVCNPLYRISRDVSEGEFRAALDQILQDVERNLGLGQARFKHTAEVEPDEEPELLELGQSGGQSRNEVMMVREMVMAGKIQADILPEEPPSLPGWDIAARLVPARETSGDFYDFIPLSDRKLGMVVADVTDKGMGAALFMALSSSLIRTYAGRYPTLPAIALSAVSERILSDTRGSMFVTAFYGILEPHTGRLVFANAGHPPGCLISTRRGKESIDRLRPTGMALGVTEEARWRQKEVRMSPGDVLVLYTDGITEAQNPNEVFFEEDRMIESVLRKMGGTAQQILDGLLTDVQHFVGPAPRQDDIAMIVIRREG
jgi:serine phosphatase RsbU (regulator of sigma subunit)